MHKSNIAPQVEVIISLYNYQDYIVQCVESVLKQSYVNIVVSVIDDGSSDNSVTILKNTFSVSSRLKLITQDNQGQLGAFNTGFENLDDKSEIVLFLDADDYMQPEYVAHIVEEFQSRCCDYIFSDPKILNMSSNVFQASQNSCFAYGDLYFGIFHTYYLHAYYGNSTSCIAITRTTLAKILPLRDLQTKWRIRADDCIIYGAALVGARMYHTHYDGVVYRVHDTNNYCGKSFDSSYEFSRTLVVQELFDRIICKNSIFLTYSVFMQEFILAPKPKKYTYLKILSVCNFTFTQKIRAFFKIILS
ncbi:MAG: glycosyltransferase family 2 protein [Helicobacter sp.]|uniref:glycosyltransferase family 2 protein n=1 Tax=Helicobacter sp. TaxID=218 RepID=UPI002A7DC321|nr:glycosyltransferase family 2 protein [Helicobacter sp.]MDY2823444.1 glycosyltransferase family 2 protein [Helicobacter sp.]